ncbi:MULTISPECIES: Wzz/FepE/Etk N-terminal domain-containing protein [unclassified Undibacterium]|uniref:Wzz/FepE/Etk N-terminal domain-containing protein n=1 Tax=unclassified Undibacterium TaxID=2630295 RepID=UPI002AC9702A|nr:MULTISPECIES: Wzz/FepE/Etk N-terminal domain-containing protein [unclassified Undibacterium]MEB0140851.1 Wzz/FepE/Etk N-terminal domain-containing protein [Undibacterium sp. CCC2.1]MEB0173804.1 Wzz/FepE/Etk N-terminal domain-containing protein [Undibacterium sp. CCC1.1]MEB0177788.1 Wzz/FepE/Etk N-terminal domain-containing protein [Undibacterium sp. CCC3.4]MEB0217351.1 Wzz/FepE/Etk N-terminal domain-containing protein [Undibacterium sp. 5I2]WPX42163.1 Wzz/FepE/Etk N-terminal domain-containi
MTTLDKLHAAPADEDDGLALMDILLTLAKHKKKIMLYPIVCGVAGLLISLCMQAVFKANTKILPPQQSQSTASAMLSQLGGLAGGAGAALGIKNPNDLYIAMLKSRAVTDKLISRFDLKKRYDVKLVETTRKMLDTNSTIAAGKDGLIGIEVEDKDPKIAMAIANAYVEELTLLTSRFALTEASQRRLFFEKQLELAKDKMIVAETTLAKGIDSKGVLSVDGQSKAVVETAARLRAAVSAKEIQLKAMQAFVTPNNNEYKRAYQELLGMQQELGKLENGNPLAAAPRASDAAGGPSSIQILRDVKYYQMLYDLLAKQYEAARLDEAKDIPLIQVLDKAIEPERKFKPQRALITLAAAMFGLIVALIAAFVAEASAAPKTPEQEEKWRQLKKYLSFR